MPYKPEHKRKTRARIVECARRLFNRRGFTEVSIDEIMAAADLTRGGFYNHFSAKKDLYAEILMAFAERQEAAIASAPQRGPALARQIVNGYVSRQHLEDLDGQCPLVALSSDVARAGPLVRAAHKKVLEALVEVFESNLAPQKNRTTRQRSLAAASTCVGAMVLARSVEDRNLADEICEAARRFAHDAIGREEQQ